MNKSVPKPALLTTAALSWLKIKRWFKKSETLAVIHEARKALSKMPTDKRGIVLGSGDNTKFWKEKGWKTLDIKPASNADYIADANHLEKVITPDSQDFLHAEFISFDPTGRKGVIAKRLVEESNKALKIGGILIIATGHHEGWPWPVPLPNTKVFANLMRTSGFQTVLELHKVKLWAETIKQQRVIYYGKKLVELA